MLKTPEAGSFKISPSWGDLEDSIRIWGVHLASSLHRDVGDTLIGAFFLPLQSLSGTPRAGWRRNICDGRLELVCHASVRTVTKPQRPAHSFPVWVTSVPKIRKRRSLRIKSFVLTHKTFFFPSAQKDETIKKIFQSQLASHPQWVVTRIPYLTVFSACTLSWSGELGAIEKGHLAGLASILYQG